VEKQKRTFKNKKNGCSEVSVNNPRIRGVSPEEEKKGYAREGFVEKGFKPGMKE